MTALEIVPDIVGKETPMINFLRADDLDPAKAARRLAMYWKYRKSVFGEDRWLLPLNLQPGMGAFSASGIDFIRSGVLAFVSRPSPVVFFDSSRVSRSIKEDAFEWAIYFATTIANEMEPFEPVRMLHKVSRGHQTIFIPELYQMVTQAMPVKMNKTALVIPTIALEQDATVRDYLTVKASMITKFNGSYKSVHVVDGGAASRTQSLQAHGLSPSSLPVSLGGVLSDNHFWEYLRMRVSIESVMGAMPHHVFLREDHSQIMNVAQEMGTRGATLVVRANNNLPKHIRERNMVYRKRYNQKQKVKEDKLHQTLRRELLRKEQLRAENMRLMGLLGKAESILTNIFPLL